MKIKVAFLCVHNSCRSQIAEALAKKYGAHILEVYSAGTELKDHINADAVRLIKNLYNIDMETTQFPKLIKDIPAVDYVITMGCNVVCPRLPFTHGIEDWGLSDPTGKSDKEFELVISEIDQKVRDFIAKIESGRI